jgi:hypothetical protein
MSDISKEDWQEIAILIEEKITSLSKFYGGSSSFGGSIPRIDEVRKQVEDYDYFMDLKLRVKDTMNGFGKK